MRPTTEQRQTMRIIWIVVQPIFEDLWKTYKQIESLKIRHNPELKTEVWITLRNGPWNQNEVDIVDRIGVENIRLFEELWQGVLRVVKLDINYIQICPKKGTIYKSLVSFKLKLPAVIDDQIDFFVEEDW